MALDLSALRTTHPWCTIRRRNHRLLPQCREPRPFPRSLPKRTVISAPHAKVLALRDDVTMVNVPVPAPPRGPASVAVTVPPPSLPLTVTGLMSLPGRPEPVPVLVLPRPMPLPWDPYSFILGDRIIPECSLPAETAYGPVQYGLALVCAREYPWIAVAIANISDIAWGPRPPDKLDEREDVLHQYTGYTLRQGIIMICSKHGDGDGGR
ncbi:hypothetical protein B0H13DRAFT_2301608 [Mycena leptocephala]|nr:hypothetical protein B0H13DRAFT_2301608 [Mycena leptocephala]